MKIFTIFKNKINLDFHFIDAQHFVEHFIYKMFTNTFLHRKLYKLTRFPHLIK